MESRMEDFMRHVATHVVEAEVVHNPPPLSDSFSCLWHHCGFETISSQEMVRHINFHAFHSKVKCHGRNMLELNNMLPCKLDSGLRNKLPDMSEPFLCEWQDCHMVEHVWDKAQDFYWHVKGHAEDLEAPGNSDWPIFSKLSSNWSMIIILSSDWYIFSKLSCL